MAGAAPFLLRSATNFRFSARTIRRAFRKKSRRNDTRVFLTNAKSILHILAHKKAKVNRIKTSARRFMRTLPCSSIILYESKKINPESRLKFRVVPQLFKVRKVHPRFFNKHSGKGLEPTPAMARHIIRPRGCIRKKSDYFPGKASLQ